MTDKKVPSLIEFAEMISGKELTPIQKIMYEHVQKHISENKIIPNIRKDTRTKFPVPHYTRQVLDTETRGLDGIGASQIIIDEHLKWGELGTYEGNKAMWQSECAETPTPKEVLKIIDDVNTEFVNRAMLHAFAIKPEFILAPDMHTRAQDVGQFDGEGHRVLGVNPLYSCKPILLKGDVMDTGFCRLTPEEPEKTKTKTKPRRNLLGFTKFFKKDKFYAK